MIDDNELAAMQSFVETIGPVGSWPARRHLRRALEIIKELRKPQDKPLAWVITSPAGAVLHFSEHDGWKIDVVIMGEGT